MKLTVLNTCDLLGVILFSAHEHENALEVVLGVLAGGPGGRGVGLVQNMDSFNHVYVSVDQEEKRRPMPIYFFRIKA